MSIGCQEGLLLAQLCPSRQVAVRRAATMCQHGFEVSLPFAADTELSILAMRALLSIEPLVSLCLVCAWLWRRMVCVLEHTRRCPPLLARLWSDAQ